MEEKIETEIEVLVQEEAQTTVAEGTQEIGLENQDVDENVLDNRSNMLETESSTHKDNDDVIL